MDRAPITRQTVRPSDPETMVPDDFVTHVYPYPSFPLLTSHLHPKFAIVEAGRKLATSASTYLPQLIVDYPILSSILILYVAWTRDPPPAAGQDSSFSVPYNEDDDDYDYDEPNDSDYGGRTPVRRHRTKRRARQVTPTPYARCPNRASGSGKKKPSNGKIGKKFVKARLADRIHKWASKTSQGAERSQVLCS
jgi:hypothetical protein